MIPITQNWQPCIFLLLFISLLSRTLISCQIGAMRVQVKSQLSSCFLDGRQLNFSSPGLHPLLCQHSLHHSNAK